MTDLQMFGNSFLRKRIEFSVSNGCQTNKQNVAFVQYTPNIDFVLLSDSGQIKITLFFDL